MKTKEKGKVHQSKTITANGVQILTGDECTRYYQTNIILLDYDTPESAHDYAKGERFALWLKLEDSRYKRMMEQLNKNLKEITLWFTDEERDKLKEFLNGVEEK